MRVENHLGLVSGQKKSGTSFGFCVKDRNCLDFRIGIGIDLNFVRGVEIDTFYVCGPETSNSRLA